MRYYFSLLAFLQKKLTNFYKRHEILKYKTLYPGRILFSKAFYFSVMPGFHLDGSDSKLVFDDLVAFRGKTNFTFHNGGVIKVGRNVFFNDSCSVNCLGSIDIGENVMFGEGVKIYDHNHQYRYDDSKLIIEPNEFKIGKVVIGKNSWIASNVTILSNVEIGENVIIGANCLIYKSVPSNSIVRHTENLSIV